MGKEMYYIVRLSTIKKDRLRKLVDEWRKLVKYRLPVEMRREIIMEKWVSEYAFLIVIDESLAGLWIVRRLEKLCEKYGILSAFAVYEAKRIFPDEKYIDQKIREKIEEIPPHLIYDIRKALLERRLPRGKRKREALEAMKM